jgi:hypothetical protein
MTKIGYFKEAIYANKEQILEDPEIGPQAKEYISNYKTNKIGEPVVIFDLRQLEFDEIITLGNPVNYINLGKLRTNIEKQLRGQLLAQLTVYGKISNIHTYTNSQIGYTFICGLYSFILENPEITLNDLYTLDKSIVFCQSNYNELKALIRLLERRPIAGLNGHVGFYLADFTCSQDNNKEKIAKKTLAFKTLVKILYDLAQD